MDGINYFVRYSTEDDENCLKLKINTLDSNVPINDTVRVWIITKPPKYYNSTIVSNSG